MIRAAIVGIGSWARVLVNSVQGKSRSIRFTTGFTRTPAAAEAFCAERGIALAPDLESVLADPEIDALVFATPHSRHAEEVIACAGAGKNVFMEKPFTLDSKSAERAIRAVERAGVVLAVGFPRRFHPAVKELEARIADGRLGKIGYCTSEQSTSSALAMPGHHWRADPQESPAGAMTALGVHNLDLMIALFGRIAEVYCVTRSRGSDRTDTTGVLIGFENGMAANLFCSIATTVSYRFAVFGNKGAVAIETPGLAFRFTALPDPGAPGRPQPPEPELLTYKGFDMVAAELEAFAAAAESGSPYPISAGDVLHGVEALEAIARSAEQGIPVKLKPGSH